MKVPPGYVHQRPVDAFDGGPANKLSTRDRYYLTLLRFGVNLTKPHSDKTETGHFGAALGQHGEEMPKCEHVELDAPVDLSIVV